MAGDSCGDAASRRKSDSLAINQLCKVAARFIYAERSDCECVCVRELMPIGLSLLLLLPAIRSQYSRACDRPIKRSGFFFVYADLVVRCYVCATRKLWLVENGHKDRNANASWCARANRKRCAILSIQMVIDVETNGGAKIHKIQPPVCIHIYCGVFMH